MIAYFTFEVSIVAKDGLKFLTFEACDIQSAYADIRVAYGDDVEIVNARMI
jgi:hypothetical protein